MQVARDKHVTVAGSAAIFKREALFFHQRSPIIYKQVPTVAPIVSSKKAAYATEDRRLPASYNNRLHLDYKLRLVTCRGKACVLATESH